MSQVITTWGEDFDRVGEVACCGERVYVRFYDTLDSERTLDPTSRISIDKSAIDQVIAGLQEAKRRLG